MQQLKQELPSADYVSSHECCGQVRRSDCVDIKTKFGRRYVLEFEDAVFAGSRCPWHRQIKCRRGFIAPGGGTTLYAYAPGGTAALGLVELCETDKRYTLQQWGNTEVAIVFDVEHFAPVATILKPLRR